MSRVHSESSGSDRRNLMVEARSSHGQDTGEGTGVFASTQNAVNAGECLCSCAHRSSLLNNWRSQYSLLGDQTDDQQLENPSAQESSIACLV